MIKKKTFLIFGLLMIIFLTIYNVRMINKSEKERNNILEKKMNKMLDKIKNLQENEKLIIYITGNSGDGDYVISSKKIMNYYKEVYGLDYISYNINDYSKFYYRNLLKILNISEIDPQLPLVVLYSKKQLSYIENFFVENDYRNLLIQNNYIDEKKLQNDYIIYNEQFKNKLKENGKVFIYISTNEKKYYRYRKYLYQKYGDKIIFYSNIKGTASTDEINKIIRENLGNTTIQGESLFIVGNNQIINYKIDFENEKSIDEFISKNHL